VQVSSLLRLFVAELPGHEPDDVPAPFCVQVIVGDGGAAKTF
jgi:hypothetical protein